MKTATASTGRATGRSVQTIAEKMAKNADIDVDEWIEVAVAEYAEDLGVDPRDLSERERLEAIEERVDRAARGRARRGQNDFDEVTRPIRRSHTPERASEHSENYRGRRDSRLSRRPEAEPHQAIRDFERRSVDHDRFADAIETIEQRAERTEQRTARALETLGGLVASRDSKRDRLEEAIRDIEKRAERNEERTARTLESLSELVESRSGERDRLEQAIKEIEVRSARNEERTARALESLSGQVEARGEERERWDAAIKRIEERAERQADRTARALDSLTALIEARAAATAGPKPRAVSVRTRVSSPRAEATSPGRPGPAPIEARFDELARRAAAPANPSHIDEDSEALRLVSERLVRRKKLRENTIDSERTPAAPTLAEVARSPIAPDLGDAVKDLQREMQTLSDRIDGLSNAAVGATTMESIRSQADEIESVLAAAAEDAAPVARLERQIAEIGARIERLTASAASPADIAAALKTLAEAQARVDRAPTAAAIAAIERRIDDLGGRIEEAARRPLPDSRPLEDLARRVEHMRAAIDNHSAGHTETANLAGKLQAISEKLDHAREAGAQSAARVASLQETTARLENAVRQPAKVTFDPQPIEELGRRIEKVRAAIDAQGSRSDSATLSAKLEAIEAKLDRLSETGGSAAAVASLAEMTARVEEALNRPVAVALDQRPLEDLARRIESLRAAFEQDGARRPDSAAIARTMQAIVEKLDRAAESGAQQSIDAMARLQAMTTQLETALRRPADSQPMADLARRIDGVRGAIERHENLGHKVEAVDATLQQMAVKLDAVAARPVGVALDIKPIDELAHRLETLRAAFEQPNLANPGSAALALELSALGRKLDKLAEAGGPAVAGKLEQTATRLEEAVRRPLAVDSRPLEDIARRIDALRVALEKDGARRPDSALLAQRMQALVDRLDSSATKGTQQSAETMSRLEEMTARLESMLCRPLDAQPIAELARRIDGVRGVLERQDEILPKVERLQATVGEISQKLDRPGAAAADVAGIEAALHKLSADLKTVAGRNAAHEQRATDELAQRIDTLRQAIERNGALSPHIERLGATLADLQARVEEAVSRPAAAAIDPKPIEALSQRLDSVRASLEAPRLAPHVERLESALGAVAEKLDRAQPMIDANGLNATLSEMNARIAEAFRRPAQVEIDRGPIEALARRIEAVRETVERQANRVEVAGRPLDELSRRLETIKTSIDRQTEQLEAGRIEEAFRKAVVKSGAAAFANPDGGRLLTAMQGLAAKLDAAGASLNAARVESLLGRIVERLDYPGAPQVEAGRAVQAIARLDGERIEAALQELADHIEDSRAERADLAAALANLAGKIDAGATTLDATRIEGMLESVLSRLDDIGLGASDISSLAHAIAELSNKTNSRDPANLSAVEGLIAGLDSRVAALDAKIANSLATGAISPADLASFELALHELAEKIDTSRDGGALKLTEDVRRLNDKLEELALAKVDNNVVDQAARTIAEKIEARGSVFDPEALLGHIADIHDRLDDLHASRPPAAELQLALGELTEELETLRSARTTDGSARALSELRADQIQFDRRMDARFSGLQDVLEKLVDRFSRIDPGVGAAEPKSAASRAPDTSALENLSKDIQSRSAIHDIPDRDPQLSRRSFGAPAVDVGQLSASSHGRLRDADDLAAKTAALNAHIAAARRAYNAAAGDSDGRKEEPSAPPAPKVAQGSSWASRAQGLIGRHPRPALLGGAVLLALATAAVELRGNHSLMRKSEIDAPATPLALNAPARDDVDDTPTGALSATPSVIAAPLPAAGVAKDAKPAAIAKAAPDLVAALPAALPVELRTAAGNGDLGAAIEIAQRYLEGRAVPREPKTAAGWLQAAVDAGSPFAEYRLGALYEKGIGVTRDPARARELYSKAADAGNARAMHNLAVLYAQDGGAGKPDYAAALEAFRRAASYGVRDSQFNLGVLYGRGLGASQDLANAWLYFSLAAKQGDADAARKRDEVATRMDGKMMAKATKLLADFKAETPTAAANDPPPAPAQAAGAPAASDPGIKGVGSRT